MGIKEQTLRSKASKLGVKKSETFMKEYCLRLQKNRKLKQKENYKNYQMDNIERNIIIESLLGDGTLSKYGRSLNACYRENTGTNQIACRKWKANKLSNLDFKSNTKGAIYSPSHPIYTEFYELFYPDGIKIIPEEGLLIKTPLRFTHQSKRFIQFYETIKIGSLLILIMIIPLF